MARDEHLQALPSAAWGDLQALVEQFESTWEDGRASPIEAYLPADPARRLTVLVELIYVEMELRFRAGQQVRVEDYLDRFPELAQASRLAVNVIVAEYQHRLKPNCRPRSNRTGAASGPRSSNCSRKPGPASPSES